MAEIDMEKVAEELLSIKAYFAGQAIEAKEEIIKEVFVEAQQTIENAISMLKEQENVKPIDYKDCANAMLKMWMEHVLTDGEYNKIMDTLNKAHIEGRL